MASRAAAGGATIPAISPAGVPDTFVRSVSFRYRQRVGVRYRLFGFLKYVHQRQPRPEHQVVLDQIHRARQRAVRLHVPGASPAPMNSRAISRAAGTVLLLRSWDQVLSVSFFMPAYRMAAALTRSAFSPGSACAAP